MALPCVGLFGGLLGADRVGSLDQMVGERVKLRWAHTFSGKPREGKTACYLQTELKQGKGKFRGEEIYRLMNLVSIS